jgi:phage terminase large subunit-like protein
LALASRRPGCERTIAETNAGGDIVSSVLRGIEAGKAKFAGAFPELEDELCGLTSGGGYEGPGRSPDRADAMVWAMAELLLGETREPRIRGL